MFSLNTVVHVPGLTGRKVTDFLVNCDDEAYRRWWPGTHLAFHTVKRVPGDVGSLVYIDEYIGSHRVRTAGVVLGIVPGKELVWQAKWWIWLPVVLILHLHDRGDGVEISHTIQVGYRGIGRLLDPLFRLHFSAGFATAMDEHVRTEFPRLRDLLHPAA